MRLFLALRPPPPVRDALARAMEGIAAARWQDDEQLHLTVRFLGEVERPQAEDLCAALDGLAAPAVRARVSGVGRFDGGGRGGAQLWAALAPREPLAALRRKVDAACARAGLKPEGRAYLPHVTLARFGRGAAGPEVERWLALHAGLATAPFTMDRLILYRSRLGHAGASYEAVHAWPLARPAD